MMPACWRTCRKKPSNQLSNRTIQPTAETFEAQFASDEARYEADHSAEAGFLCYTKAASLQCARDPLACQPQFPIGAHVQLPLSSLTLMQQVMNGDVGV